MKEFIICLGTALLLSSCSVNTSRKGEAAGAGTGHEFNPELPAAPSRNPISRDSAAGVTRDTFQTTKIETIDRRTKSLSVLETIQEKIDYYAPAEQNIPYIRVRDFTDAYNIFIDLCGNQQIKSRRNGHIYFTYFIPGDTEGDLVLTDEVPLSGKDTIVAVMILKAPKEQLKQTVYFIQQ